MQVRRVARMSLEQLTARRCAQECSLAGVQLQVADGLCKPGADHLFFPFVLTGVDEGRQQPMKV